MLLPALLTSVQLTSTADVFRSMLAPTACTLAAPPSRQYGAGTASLNVAVAASIILHHFANWAGYPERQREVRTAAALRWCCRCVLACMAAVQSCRPPGQSAASAASCCCMLAPPWACLPQVRNRSLHALLTECHFACLLAAHFLSAGPEVCSGGAAAAYRPPQ